MRISIVGPTASGKTNIAIDIATQMSDVALLSCDSMAVYKYMDLGTAKPNRIELRGVQYYLIDLVEPSEEFSIAQFRKAASLCEDSLEAANVPVYVGGSGLYHSAVFDSLAIPPTDATLRHNLELAIKETGTAVFYQRLQALDPEAASRIDPNNVRRIVRALEVIELTGQRFSSFGPGINNYRPSSNKILGIHLEVIDLDKRIADRVDKLIANGWVEECMWLRENTILSRTARLAIGYREMFDYLAGLTSMDQTRVDIIRRSQKLARRQRSWFARDPRIEWFDDPKQLLNRAKVLLASR